MLLLLLVSDIGTSSGPSFESHLRGPSFVMEPPSKLEFSNSSGGWLDCSATGSPQPTIDWQAVDGTSVGDVIGIRRVLRNGTLMLLPFPAAAYRQDIHSTIYRCVASNNIGRIMSRDVQVRAGKYSEYSIIPEIRSDLSIMFYCLVLSKTCFRIESIECQPIFTVIAIQSLNAVPDIWNPQSKGSGQKHKTGSSLVVMMVIFLVRFLKWHIQAILSCPVSEMICLWTHDTLLETKEMSWWKLAIYHL